MGFMQNFRKLTNLMKMYAWNFILRISSISKVGNGIFLIQEVSK